MKNTLTLAVLGFMVVCLATAGGWLVSAEPTQDPARGPLLRLQQTTRTAGDVNTPPALEPGPAPTELPPLRLRAVGGAPGTLTLGSTDPNADYNLALELTTRGAAVRRVTLSRFDNRDPDHPGRQVFLTRLSVGGQDLGSFANRDLVLITDRLRLRLDRLDWELLRQTQDPEGVQSATFAVTITDANDRPLLRLSKTFRLRPATYLLDCDLDVENLGTEARDLYLRLTGPVGPTQEASRQDMRKVLTAYEDAHGQVRVPKSAKLGMRKLKKADSLEARTLSPANPGDRLLWAATTNKYFAGILVPDTGQIDPNAPPQSPWIRACTGLYDLGDGKTATLGLQVETQPITLAPAVAQHYGFKLYVGPKDKTRFDRTPLYQRLGFAYVIDFIGCCCPAALIRPLAFLIMSLMNAMNVVFHNYGVVIIILVFLMRLAMHPVTKKSQVSMHKMSKLAPRAEEIKKRYANNKAEMNKHLMELYREQGASPIMGFLPMMFQMPIWIALWSAVNSSIHLRGAAFLPFWITDLSVPDHLFRFPGGVELPLLGAYFNLLPLLMGVAFYLQQKLMPTQQNAAANPQMAQQQKMMMVMMPLLFPVMMYSVPSGVNLYIMTSTFAGVLEQVVIRKHIREREETESIGRVAVTSKTGGKRKKRKPKPMFRNFK